MTGEELIPDTAPETPAPNGIGSPRVPSELRSSTEPSPPSEPSSGRPRKIGRNRRGGVNEYMAPEQLAPWAKNPKKKNAKWKRAVEKVARSIQEFGFGAPIVARETKLSDGRHEIIKGHVRFEAATLLGLTKIPVRLMPLSAKKSHLLAAADNELAKISEADDEAMEQLLADYDEEERAIAGFEPSDDVDESKASEIEEVDVSAITAEFWMTVRGPLPKQPEAIEALKAAMAKLPGVTVEHGIFGS